MLGFLFGSSRKRLFVNGPIQGSVITRFAGYWLVYHFVLWHTLFIFDFLQTGVDLMNGESQRTLGELYMAFSWKYCPLLVAALAILPLLLHDSLKTTHRIAGPLVRFRNALRALRDGQFVREVRLREGDLLMDFQEDFNEFLNFYNNESFHAQAIMTAVGAQEEPEEEQLLRQVYQIRQESQLENAQSLDTRLPRAEA